LDWISPTYACARWIYVDVEPPILVFVRGFVGSTELGFVEDLEGPELTCCGFHVLKAAEPMVEILA